MATAPFPVTPELTAIAIRYRNTALIADAVAPRAPVGLREFKWFLHTMADGFTVPDTRVGRRSRPAEIEFSATEQTAAVVDYGLDVPIPQSDLDNAPVNYDPRARATEGVMDLVLLDREKRVADLVFSPGSYSASQRVTLSGSSQFSDPDSDPIATVADALDTPIVRPNVAVFGQRTWTLFRRHPKVVKAVLGNAGDSGQATRQQVADVLEVAEVVVGQGFLNTARRGQAPVMQRVWGKHLSLIHRANTIGADGMNPSFAWTAQFGDRFSGSIPDRDIGLRGGERVRAGESVRELISAPDFGFLFQNAVA